MPRNYFRLSRENLLGRSCAEAFVAVLFPACQNTFRKFLSENLDIIFIFCCRFQQIQMYHCIALLINNTPLIPAIFIMKPFLLPFLSIIKCQHAGTLNLFAHGCKKVCGACIPFCNREFF